MKALLASVVLLLASGAAAAQEAPPPMAHPRTAMLPLKRADLPAMVARYFAALDANHDGGVTEAELRAARRARMEAMHRDHRDREFARLDSDRNGAVSRQEFDAPPPAGPGREGKAGDMAPPPPLGGPGGFGMMMMGGAFERADANKDGKVTLAEAQKAALALFDEADVNRDGVVDRDEMRGLMMAHVRGPGPHRPGGRGPAGPGPDMPPPPPPQ